MALICCAVYDTEANGRSEYTEQTLRSLMLTVDLDRHPLVVIDNASCEATKAILSHAKTLIKNMTIITNSENVGTAMAINMGLRLRGPQQHCIKIDNDCVVNYDGWVDEMEETIERDPTIGIIGLKRKDIDFDPNHANLQYRSELIGLPHQSGQRWITVEKGPHIMGTCTMFNWRLVDKIGGMKQSGVYGNDDSLYSLRSLLADFWNCYLPHIDIDHIDRGDNQYVQEKYALAGEGWNEYTQMYSGYVNGIRPLWEDFE